jgi:hypothetical protein
MTKSTPKPPTRFLIERKSMSSKFKKHRTSGSYRMKMMAIHNLIKPFLATNLDDKKGVVYCTDTMHNPSITSILKYDKNYYPILETYHTESCIIANPTTTTLPIIGYIVLQIKTCKYAHIIGYILYEKMLVLLEPYDTFRDFTYDMKKWHHNITPTEWLDEIVKTIETVYKTKIKSVFRPIMKYLDGIASLQYNDKTIGDGEGTCYIWAGILMKYAIQINYNQYLETVRYELIRNYWILHQKVYEKDGMYDVIADWSNPV